MIETLALTLACGAVGESAAGFTSIVAPSTGQYPRNTEGSIVRLKNGTLLLAWSRFCGGAADASAAEIAATISNDGGRSWGEPFVIQPDTGKQNVMSVSLLRLSSGRIGMFYLQKNGEDDSQVYARYSSDEAKTWSVPTRVSLDDGYHVMNNDRVVQLSSGRILCPVAYTPDCRMRNVFVSFCLYSDDQGKTWSRSTPDLTAPNRGAMEPGLAELVDGRLIMIIRTQEGRIYNSFACDRGSTWSESAASDVAAPEAPATIKRIPGTDYLLLIWNNNYEPGADHKGKRTPLTAAISTDSGRTWSNVKNIETDPQKTFAYTSVAFAGGSALLTYWEGAPGAPGLSLRFRSIPLSWFTESEK